MATTQDDAALTKFCEIACRINPNKATVSFGDSKAAPKEGVEHKYPTAQTGNAAARTIATQIRNNTFPAKICLNLSGLQFGPEELAIIINALKQEKELKHVHLIFNKNNLGDDGLALLYNELILPNQFTTLRLSLQENGITATATETLTAKLQVLISPLHLELDVTKNDISSTTVNSLKGAASSLVKHYQDYQLSRKAALAWCLLQAHKRNPQLPLDMIRLIVAETPESSSAPQTDPCADTHVEPTPGGAGR